MFKAISVCLKKSYDTIQIKDADGYWLGDEHCGKTISKHFETQFYNSSHANRLPTEIPVPLNKPILATEFQTAFKSMSNNKSPGIDNIPGELLKYGGKMLAEVTAEVFNKLFLLNDTELLKLGDGILIALQKPGKIKGLCTNLRPIVLRLYEKVFH